MSKSTEKIIEGINVRLGMLRKSLDIWYENKATFNSNFIKIDHEARVDELESLLDFIISREEK